LKSSSIYLHEKQALNANVSVLSADVEMVNSEGDLFTSDSTVLLVNRAPRDSSYSLSGKYSIRLDEKKRYSFTLEMDRNSPCYEIITRVWRKRKTQSDLQKVKTPSVLVVSTDNFNFYKNIIIDRRLMAGNKSNVESNYMGTPKPIK
jgi:hypothetical protein